MKFGHEYEQSLSEARFPEQWLGSAIDYKYLKKCIKKVHNELDQCGLDPATIMRLSKDADANIKNVPHQQSIDRQLSQVSDDMEASHLTPISEGFSPQLRILVDSKTGTPLDATLTQETKAGLQKLAQHGMATGPQNPHIAHHATHAVLEHSGSPLNRTISPPPDTTDAKWVQIPLVAAQDFFDLLGPKLDQLEQLRIAETAKLEMDILDLGDAVEDVVEPVREGFEAVREVNYRDLYFWREMFRLYMDKPIFYDDTEQRRGAVSYDVAKGRLEAYKQELKDTGLLAKMKTPEARKAAKQFLKLNVDILNIMRFQEMNARAMTKILKKFDKQTHLEAQPFLKELLEKYPALTPNGIATKPSSGFAECIARDLHAEISSKVLAIVPQIQDWTCPVCTEMAWRPVSLGCCQALLCIRCVITMQEQEMRRCPACNAETVMGADGRNINFEAMDFLEKYFPLETKKRQKENEKADLERRYGEEFTRPGCCIM
ncbi:hypothetical protein LTR62_002294 [Meristemomyces frigidus]|uniref:SPX domain-containing protein n=1 Tax=Meristemomyces frigidus TaxID=1508187 RepID=A0AAN7YHU8_9PEZI|nr:hypothetical protein LTR62_002294 [Meristemomyces frigidus]